ncbi:uncharacterized protein LOC119797973 [Cyprinodon tularosa]|uniref:uncharacterized protein LOC119797973 n=1 Tax=Cyprinodon tularosa TaxID=77115 RepID=UPI0018E2265A|nr:uncharacterized protein LOC119797973 [Cyprinodon tularosa]
MFQIITSTPLGVRDTNGGSSMTKHQNHQPLSVNSNIKGKNRITGKDGLKLDQKAQLLVEKLQKISLSTEKVANHFPKAYKTRSPTYNREKSQTLRRGIADVGSVTAEVARRAAEPRSREEISEVPDGNQSLESRSTNPCKLETPNLKTEEHLSQEEWESNCEEIGRSVCKIIVDGVCQGTGFVLVDRLIMTSAHLFRDPEDLNKLLVPKEVNVVFDQKTNKRKPHPGPGDGGSDPVLDEAGDEEETSMLCFTVEETFVDIDIMLDYAVLALIPKGQGAKQPQVPPGLLRRFGPVLGSGDICIIGYPYGGEKTFKYTSIINKENREKVKEEHLAQYKGLIITENSVRFIAENQGFNDIIMGGFKANQVTTYCSSMYEGTSGSPVTGRNGRQGTVIAKHVGGYGYGFPKITRSVIEFAHPLITIFKKLVDNLKENGKEQWLDKVRLEVQKNFHLKKLIK